MSVPLQQGPVGPDGPRFRRLYPAPRLWPTSNTLRAGAAAFIAAVLGFVLLIVFLSWSSGDHSTSDPYNPYGQGLAVHGGQPR